MKWLILFASIVKLLSSCSSGGRAGLKSLRKAPANSAVINSQMRTHAMQEKLKSLKKLSAAEEESRAGVALKGASAVSRGFRGYRATNSVVRGFAPRSSSGGAHGPVYGKDSQ